MSRRYQKKSDYWNKFSQGNQPPTNPSLAEFLNGNNDYEPTLTGDPFYMEAKASYDRNSVSNTSSSRLNAAGVIPDPLKYANIKNGFLPFRSSASGHDAKEPIELCQKAYANIAIVRNAIDIMSEFANARIILEGGTQKARDFFDNWMKYVKIWKIKSQYFLEYYRSGNVFFYKINAKFNIDDFTKLTQSYAASVTIPSKTALRNEPPTSLTTQETPTYDIKNQVPIRYTLINPYFITVNLYNSWDTISYQKVMTQYEFNNLKNPKNAQDKLVFDTLTEEAKKKVTDGAWSLNTLNIPLNPANIITSFYKKQDYEPFAIPFAFPVLEDINFKLEMKKIDQAICRTIENVVLLITMGTEPSKGGINHKNIKAMQGLLQNQSVGRVLVADFTTKAEFVIPDMNKVLGPAKYEIVNQDIKEGLQNILIGSEKFSNTAVKAQVFFERLKEAREAFLHDFLVPEMELIFKNLGFKGKCPVPKFEEVSIKDEDQFNRVITRMMELGILPPEQGLNTLETGIYPTAEELDAAQVKFVEDRKKGFYNPIVGGIPFIAPPADPNAKSAAPGSKPAPVKEVGRPLGAKATMFAKDNIMKVLDLTKDLYSTIEASLKKKYNKKSLTKDQKTFALSISEAIIVGQNCSTWNKTAAEVMENPGLLDNLSILEDIQTVAADHDLDVYASALLFHSTKI